jgi:hypothetical protein
MKKFNAGKSCSARTVMDCRPRSPDFVTGEVSEELAAMIRDVIDNPGCE